MIERGSCTLSCNVMTVLGVFFKVNRDELPGAFNQEIVSTLHVSSWDFEPVPSGSRRVFITHRHHVNTPGLTEGTDENKALECGTFLKFISHAPERGRLGSPRSP